MTGAGAGAGAGDDRYGLMGRREWLRLGATGAAALGLPACAAWEGDAPSAELPPLRTPAGTGDADWADVRAHFLVEPGTAYLNNASIGMPPRQVVDAVAAGYRAMAELPVRGRSDLSARIAEHVVPGLAGLFSVRPDELTLTRNASEALHLQSIGVALSPGDEVLITTQEHPAGRRPWEFRQVREGVRVNEVFIPSPLPPEEEVLSRFEDAITPRTRAVSFCHVTRGGHLYPVGAICGLARERGLVSLVDGAQAVGQFPIDLAALGCDAYSVSLHKWMLAPAGTGFLFVRRDARDRIRTAFAPDATPEQPQFGPPGTAAFPVRAAVGTAVDFVGGGRTRGGGGPLPSPVGSPQVAPRGDGRRHAPQRRPRPERARVDDLREGGPRRGRRRGRLRGEHFDPHRRTPAGRPQRDPCVDPHLQHDGAGGPLRRRPGVATRSWPTRHWPARHWPARRADRRHE